MAKKNPADAAVSDVENDGRKTRAKRPVYYYGLPKGTKIETVQQPGETWTPQFAEEQLRKELGKDCIIIGPDYKVQGVKTEAATLTVKVDLRQLQFTTDQFAGEHGGWKIFGNGLKACTVDGEDFDDNELIQVQVESLVDEKNKVQKPRINQKIVRRSMLDQIAAA